MDFRTFFGQQARRLRLDKGETQEQIGRAVRYSDDAIRKMESGDRPPPEGVEDYLDEHYDTKGVLAALGREARADARGFPDWVEQEQRATDIRTYDMGLIPGLLQTPDYAREVITTLAPWQTDVEEAVQLRMQRQAVLTRAKVRAVIEQSALECAVGDTTTQIDQLAHLLATPKNVTVQVVPSSVRIHPGKAGPLILLRFNGTPEVLARVDGRSGGNVIDDPVAVRREEQAFDEIIGVALPKDHSAELIEAMIEELSRNDL